MKLVFYSSIGVPWGGSEVLWTDTAMDALNQNHDVLISVFDWPQQHSKIIELKNKGAILIYRRRFFPSFAQRFKKKLLNIFLSSSNKITYHEYLNKFNADHIFFNLAGGDEIAVDTNDLFLFIKQTSIPFSVFYHSLSTEKYLNKDESSNFRYVLSKSSNNFFTSQMQIDLLQNQLDCKIKNVSILNHPLREIFHEHNLEANQSVNFAIIGSLTKRWKGQDIVINILSKEKWRNLKFVLNVYGDGPDKEDLIDLIRNNGLQNKVRIHEYVEDINKIFYENDIILIPSRQDSGPIVLFEAMLAGKTIVGSFMGAIPDYIKTGYNGVLSLGCDEEAFEFALDFTLKNKKKWSKWGLNARNHLLQNYDFNAAQSLLNKITKK